MAIPRKKAGLSCTWDRSAACGERGVRNTSRNHILPKPHHIHATRPKPNNHTTRSALSQLSVGNSLLPTYTPGTDSRDPQRYIRPWTPARCNIESLNSPPGWRQSATSSQKSPPALSHPNLHLHMQNNPQLRFRLIQPLRIMEAKIGQRINAGPGPNTTLGNSLQVPYSTPRQTTVC